MCKRVGGGTPRVWKSDIRKATLGTRRVREKNIALLFLPAEKTVFFCVPRHFGRPPGEG